MIFNMSVKRRRVCTGEVKTNLKDYSLEIISLGSKKPE